MNTISHFPTPKNEPIYDYEANSPARKHLVQELNKQFAITEDIPMYIEGKKIYTSNKKSLYPPHDHQHVLATYNIGTKAHVEQAIEAALKAAPQWRDMHWEQRAAIFLKAADLISTKYRYKINAATMLCQSKNAYQAEIDAVCELADFLRFNVHFMEEIYKVQPISSALIKNTLEYRALEGFVLAITPFNFTAIAGNLCAAPALMGNVVVWKPNDTQIYTANIIMEIFVEAGLPAGVINLIYADGQEVGEVAFQHPMFAGLHFTGSSKVFNHLWQEIGKNLNTYKNYPRIVGETGGKDFILAYNDVEIDVLVTAMIRGAYEYQGQKCSAASRAYIPQSIWDKTLAKFLEKVNEIKIGDTRDFGNLVNAVISEAAFDNITNYIEKARKIEGNQIICGGTYDKSKGYFISPTAIVSKDPKSLTMCEEIFGPVLTIFVYNDEEFDAILDVVDSTSPYALTGAFLCQDRNIINYVSKKLGYSAGNFYINDKPTGAVVGQQPFGGARGSGTNDKAGSYLNLLRWVSPRTIKENFVPPTDYKYPFML